MHVDARLMVQGVEIAFLSVNESEWFLGSVMWRFGVNTVDDECLGDS